MPKEAVADIVIRARELREAILDQPAAPAPDAARLLDEARSAGAGEAAAVVLSALAHAHRERLEHREALDCAGQAVDWAQAAAASAEIAHALVTRAMIHLESGDALAATADLHRARAIGPLEPGLALATGLVASHAGHVLLARDVFTRLAEDPGVPDAVRMRSLNNLAHLLLESNPEEAARRLRAAQQLIPSARSMAGPVIQFNIGLAHAHAGRVPAAMAAFDRALRAQDLLGGGLAAEFHLGMAAVLGQLRLLAEARAAAARALAALAGEGGALIRADALVSAARLAVLDGDRGYARARLSEAHALYTGQHRPAGAAIAARELLALESAPDAGQVAGHAAALADLGLVREAARGWLQAAAVAEACDELMAAQRYWQCVTELAGGDVLHGHEARARLAGTAGNRGRAEEECRAALEVVDLRSVLAGAPDLRHRISAERIGFEQLLRRAAADDRPAARLDALLRTRPPAGLAGGGRMPLLGDAPVGPGARPSPSPEPDGGDQAELRLQWRELAHRVESADESPQALLMLTARLAETERRLRVTSWTAAAAGAGRPAYGLSELHAHVGMPILAIVRVGARAVGFHHDEHSTTAADLGNWPALTRDLAQLERGLGRVAGGGGGPAAYESCRAVADDLDQRLRLLPATSGPLLVLLDRGLEAGVVTALPRIWPRAVRYASLAVTAAEVDVDAGSARALVAAGPRLEHAQAESDRVAAVWRSPAPARECAQVLAGLPRASVVHLAAHASLRWDNPLQSVVHLDDGPLTLTEICERAAGPRRTRLLYLSACSLGASSADASLVGAVPVLSERVAHEVVAASAPLPDVHAPGIAAAVHAAVRDGRGAAAGLADARARVDPEDPAQTGLWAALATVAAHTAAP